MSCRHRDGDPKCSTKNPIEMAIRVRNLVEEADVMAKRWISNAARVTLTVEPGMPASTLPASPNPSEFSVIRCDFVSNVFFIIEAQYPSCAACSYEGRKLMVFRVDKPAVFWSRIDPHFRDPSKPVGNSEAPSPIARFPATEEGWDMAHTFCYAMGETL